MNEPTNVEDLLLSEIGTLFAKLEKLEAGTDEYSKVNAELVKLIERAESMEKFHIERDENRKDRIVKYGIAIGSTILEVSVLIWGAKKSWKFEETGTITSTAGRSFMGKILSVFKHKR